METFRRNKYLQRSIKNQDLVVWHSFVCWVNLMVLWTARHMYKCRYKHEKLVCRSNVGRFVWDSSEIRPCADKNCRTGICVLALSHGHAVLTLRSLGSCSSWFFVHFDQVTPDIKKSFFLLSKWGPIECFLGPVQFLRMEYRYNKWNN